MSSNKLDQAILSHLALRLSANTGLIDNFFQQAIDLELDEIERYLNHLIVEEFSDLSIGVCSQKETTDTLIGYFVKNHNLQIVSDQAIDDLSADPELISNFLEVHANIEGIRHHYNLLDRKSLQEIKKLDNYIFLELMMQMFNKKNQALLADGEYLTIINQKFSTKYLYFFEAKGTEICKINNHKLKVSKLEHFIEKLHAIKIDSEQLFYNLYKNHELTFDKSDYSEFSENVFIHFLDRNKEIFTNTLSSYKKLFTDQLKFDVYDILEDNIDQVILGRIKHGWRYAFNVVTQIVPQSKMDVQVSENIRVLKYLNEINI